MGILNITPDSFSDGGRFKDTAAVVDAGCQMLKAGADILDIGGESTRPGAAPVDTEAELQRVIPAVETLAKQTQAVISIDTQKAVVAREALRHGAHIINDVSALTHDPAMLDVAGEFGAGVVLMHMRGTPRTMQDAPVYENVTADVRDYLETRITVATGAGLLRETLAVDPGIGFGKTAEHNVKLIAELEQIASLNRPILIGLSRKRFLGQLTDTNVHNRLFGSVAGLACAVLNGAHIMRVHDVRASAEAARVAAAIRGSENPATRLESKTC